MRTVRLKNYIMVAVSARISLNLKPRIDNAFLPPLRAFHNSEQKYKFGNKLDDKINWSWAWRAGEKEKLGKEPGLGGIIVIIFLVFCGFEYRNQYWLKKACVESPDNAPTAKDP